MLLSLPLRIALSPAERSFGAERHLRPDLWSDGGGARDLPAIAPM